MNNNEKNEKNETKINNNNYLLKSLHLIKINFPSSDVFYAVMFFFKYIGVIVNSRIIEMILNKEIIHINKYLCSFLIFGKNFKVILNHYQLITIIGALLLLVFILFSFFSFLYMKIKYQSIKTLIQEKMDETNKIIEEILFKIISYIYLTIIFFHQYILEYYFFGFYSFIYYQIGLFSKNGIVPNIYIETLHLDYYEYFSNNNHLAIFLINLVVIIIIFCFLFIFLLFNNTKGLFLINGMNSGNMKYLVMKLILLSLQPLFGITNFYKDESKLLFGLILNCIIIVFCSISFWSCLYQFGYYPNKVSNLSLFLEFFVYFTSITEIIIYLTGSKNNAIFFLIKLFIELINSYFLMRLFLYIKDNYNLNIFAKNLFSKNCNNSKGGLYYYMRIYLEYQKDKFNNYLKIFRILTTHIKNCKKSDCPGNIIIPIEYFKSMFVPTTVKSRKMYNKKKTTLRNEKNKGKESDDDDSEEENLFNNYKILDNNYFENNEKNILREKKKIHNNNCNDSIFVEPKKLSDKQFQIIFEQEIINQIDYLYKSKKFNILEDFIFIHLQYLYIMKKNYCLALYYIGKYSKCGIKWSFMTQYYLHEYKNLIISNFFNETNIEGIDNNVNKYRKDNHFMNEIIDYFIFSAILKNLVIISCKELKLLFNFRKDLHIPIFIKTYKRSKTSKLFKAGEILKNNIDKILFFLRHHFNENGQKVISAELSYVISNFFIFTENKIPNDLKKFINPIFDINIITNKLESGYKFFNLVHPLILALTKTNKFQITYFSSVICNRLGFFQYELKDKDFHEKLFPGIRFVKQHELLMKQFLFFDSNSYIKKDTFLKTKEGYLIGVKITVKKFPTYYDEFFLICGLDFNDDLFLSEINKNFNRYSFLLDENLDFISQTKNFYEDFEFNICMFKEIKTNFFDFFCVDKNMFNEKLKKKNYNLFKTNLTNNIVNLKKEDDAFTLFKTISYEKVYELRDISKLESMKNEYIIIRDKIPKDKILKMIPEFSKFIDEYGLDFEWYQRLDYLHERLSIKEVKKEIGELAEHSKNIVSLGFDSNNKKSHITNNSSNIIVLNKNNNNKEIKIENKDNINTNNSNNYNNIIIPINESLGGKSHSSFSLLSKKINNNNDENYPKRIIENNNINEIKIILDRNFDVVYNLKKIGTIFFYIVDLYEKVFYKNDYNNSLIYEPKYKYSLNKKKIFGKDSFKLENNNDYTFIKAKTLFSNKSKNIQNFPQFESGKIKIKLKENSNIEEEDKIIEKVKTWVSENNSIDIKKHLIKEGERIYNNGESLKLNTRIDKISINSDENERNKNIILNNNRNNLEKKTKKIEKTKLKDKLENKYNNHYNNFDLKKNEDDDEKISIITKDILDEYIKKRNTFNYYYIIIVFILFFILIIIILIKFIFARTNFSFSSYLTTAMIFLEEIKSDIYMGSIILLSQCLRKNKELSFGLADFSFQLTIKSTDLMSHLNGFEKQIELAQNNNLLSNIINYLYNNITIYKLDPDWGMKVESSYLLKEINYFSYLLKQQSTQVSNKCNFEKNFYLLLFNKSEEIYELNNNEETSFYQRFLYYIIMNIINVINPLLGDIIEEIIAVQVKIMNNYLNKVIIISISSIFILILNYFIILLKNLLDSNFIKKIILYIYFYDQSELQYEYEINYLEITAKEFNLNNIISLENIKRINNFNSTNINNSNELRLSNFNNNDENINNNITRESLDKDLIKNNKNDKNNLIESMFNKNHKIGNILDQNSISGSLFNKSMNNNSMMQLLNKNNNKDGINKIKNENNNINKYNNEQNNNNNKKIKNKKLSKNKSQIEDYNKIFKDNEDALELLKTNKKIIPFSLIFSIYISLLFFLIFLIIFGMNIIDINNKRDLWEYGINLSMNYLEKIPKIIEFGLSTFLSIILGNSNKAQYYKIEEYQKYQPKFMTYFTQRKNYENSELISSNIKDSLFANKLYDNYRIKKNIEFCENDNFFSNYFEHSKYWNEKLNEENKFCVNAGLNGILFFNKWISTLDYYFSFLDQMAYTCKNENEKINESGLDLEIDFILHELTYLYIDFEERKNQNISLAREIFIENNNFKRMLRDMNIPFTIASGALFSAVDEDMNYLNNLISYYELIFISITFIFDGIFLCFLIIMIIINEKTKKIFLFIGKILKK